MLWLMIILCIATYICITILRLYYHLQPGSWEEILENQRITLILIITAVFSMVIMSLKAYTVKEILKEREGYSEKLETCVAKAKERKELVNGRL